MELNEIEKRRPYQAEGCEQYVIVNEISMAAQYADDLARRKAAGDLWKAGPPVGYRVHGQCVVYSEELPDFRIPRTVSSDVWIPYTVKKNIDNNMYI